MNIIFGRSFDIVNMSKSYFDAVFEILFANVLVSMVQNRLFLKLVSV